MQMLIFRGGERSEAERVRSKQGLQKTRENIYKLLIKPMKYQEEVPGATAWKTAGKHKDMAGKYKDLTGNQ